jgi:hypothetical protein
MRFRTSTGGVKYSKRASQELLCPISSSTAASEERSVEGSSSSNHPTEEGNATRTASGAASSYFLLLSQYVSSSLQAKIPLEKRGDEIRFQDLLRVVRLQLPPGSVLTATTKPLESHHPQTPLVGVATMTTMTYLGEDNLGQETIIVSETNDDARFVPEQNLPAIYYSNDRTSNIHNCLDPRRHCDDGNVSFYQQSDESSSCSSSSSDYTHMHDDNSDDHDDDTKDRQHQPQDSNRPSQRQSPLLQQEEESDFKQKNGDTKQMELLSWYPELQEWIANTMLLVGLIVNQFQVQRLILLLIILNAIEMGVATLPTIEENPELNQIFSVVDQIFLIVFTLELLLQVVHPMDKDSIEIHGSYLMPWSSWRVGCWNRLKLPEPFVSFGWCDCLPD